jgi:hypothetical protein
MFTRIASLGRKLFSCESGSIAMHVGLMASAIVGMASLGAEITYLFSEHREMQVIADAAALSAATASLHSANSSAPLAEARAIAAQLGFVHGAGGATVAMNSPPTSGFHTTSPRAYEVVLNRPQTLGLIGVLRSNAFATRSRAVASLYNDITAPVCVLALDTTASHAIEIANNGALTSNACGLASNSSSSTSIYLKNNAYINGPVSSVGGWDLENGAELRGSPNTQNSTVTEDPYQNVTPPPAPACTTQTIDGNANGATYNLTPGRFCDGWNLSTQSNNVTLNLASGVYYIDQVLSLQNNATINGTSVTLVINGNYEVSIKNNVYINLTAPTSGDTTGVAIMGLRDATSTLTQLFDNNAIMNIQGAVYFPNQIVKFENNGMTGQTGCTQVIGRLVRLSNNVLLDSTCENTGVTEIFVQQSWLVE